MGQMRRKFQSGKGYNKGPKKMNSGRTRGKIVFKTTRKGRG